MVIRNGYVPSQSHVLWGGAVEVYCFGRKTGDWSLRGATPEAASKNNPGILDRISLLSEKFRTGPIYAPSPAVFNGKVLKPLELRMPWLHGRLYRGANADGVALDRPGIAFAVSSGDCPTVVLRDPLSGCVVAAHAGLKSLLEATGGAPLPSSMWSALPTEEGRIVRGFIACGIGAHAYTLDPTNPCFTDSHRRQLKELKARCPGALIKTDSYWLVDIGLAFRTLMNTYVSMERIGFDGACTHDDLDEGRNPLWHSHRRGDMSRNLVLVIRRY